MEQWFEYRKNNWWSFSLYLIKLSLKMIGWKEQEPETELSIKHLKLSITHCFKVMGDSFMIHKLDIINFRLLFESEIALFLNEV